MSSTSDLARDPSIPTVGDICHFMRLPQELRDMIYEYAVTGPNNRVIYCRHTNRQILQISSPNSITPNQNLIEANPLRFVSKQLRAETLGLTLKFNTSVVFSGRTQDRGDSSAITHCTTFINECSRAVLANLSRIELELSGNVSYLPFGSINCLAGDIYAKNPQISLIVRLMHWNVMDDTFIWYFSEYGEYIVYACQFLRLENMKNLRFMPCGDFDRKRLRRKVLKEMQNLFPRGKEMLEEAKQWYKKGIPGVVEAAEEVNGEDNAEDDEDEDLEEDPYIFDEGDLQCLFDYEEESRYPSDAEDLEDEEGGEDEEGLMNEEGN